VTLSCAISDLHYSPAHLKNLDAMKVAMATNEIHQSGPENSLRASIKGSTFGSSANHRLIAKAIHAMPTMAATADTHSNIFDIAICYR
jgi:hypothetical protein